MDNLHFPCIVENLTWIILQFTWKLHMIQLIRQIRQEI